MKNINLEELLDRIHSADETEINPIINAITERFAEVWSEWELLTLSIQGHDNESRIDGLQKSIDLLKAADK